MAADDRYSERKQTARMDPMQIRLNEVVYNERLKAVEQARRRAMWTPVPGLIDRLWQAVGRILGSLRRPVCAELPPGKVER
jgi:hypothetical protein